MQVKVTELKGSVAMVYCLVRCRRYQLKDNTALLDKDKASINLKSLNRQKFLFVIHWLSFCYHFIYFLRSLKIVCS